VLNKLWGLALFLFVALAPRVAVRLRDPEAFFRLGRRRLRLGYSGAVAGALACLPAASVLNIRSWVEAVPVQLAQDLMLASPAMAYVLAALVAWFIAALFSLPQLPLGCCPFGSQTVSCSWQLYSSSARSLPPRSLLSLLPRAPPRLSSLQASSAPPSPRPLALLALLGSRSPYALSRAMPQPKQSIGRTTSGTLTAPTASARLQRWAP
jgi:hypothetical protein